MDATMYSLIMDRYRKKSQTFIIYSFLFEPLSDRLYICKCTENQILADLYFSAPCLNRQNPQKVVTDIILVFYTTTQRYKQLSKKCCKDLNWHTLQKNDL